ncbi:MAG: D-alanyl-D-alanine carboxypeptidase [Lachnospiraceae bacterium]|nr:D-alanyl-D-alanine carboxypeptidase [Lachnospiraceae bacterium]
MNINKKLKCLLSGMLSLILLASTPMGVSAETKDEIIQRQRDKIVETNQITNWPMGPTVTADSAILMDAETGAILYAKDIHSKQYPASTTKILTALIAAENCRMDEIVTFSYDSVHDMPRGSSHIAIDPGEELTMEQSLQAILIASANEVSFAVAEHIVDGDWEDFAPIMNQRATELGCLNSNFVNPNGLPDDNHYTTAYDLAMIGKAFFANELLCKYASSTLLHIPPTDKQKDDIYAATTNELFKGRKYPYEHIVASKTGYTDDAKNCLVSCAEKDGLKLICVVLHDYAPEQYKDTIALFDYGFANFEQLNISQVETKYNIDGSNFFYNNNDIFGSSKPILSLNTQDCITIPKTAVFEDVTSSISYTDTAPGEVAVITYSYHGQVIGTASVDLAVTEEVSYAFDTSLPTDTTIVAAPKEENVIFINVIKVILWILGISAGLIVLIILISIVRNYHFEPATSRTRRGWLKSRRKKRNRYQQTMNAQRRRKKAKRPSRLRDYDF